MSTESAEIRRLFGRIAACKRRAIPLKATAFRSAGVKYANEADLLSGRGAGDYGGRWNPRGLDAIYASLDPVTAVKESYQAFLAYGFSAAVIRPRVMVALTIDVRQVWDLTNHRIRRSLGFTAAELIEEDWFVIQSNGEESWTQALGRGAASARFEGILVASARDPTGRNVVIFPRNLHRRSTVVAMAKDELPPHPNHWP